MKKQKIRGLRFGYVKFSGIGGYSEKMITELLENGVAIRGVEIKDGKIFGAVSPLDYYRTAETARKYGVRIRAGERGGIYFTLSRYRSRVGLCVGALLSLFMLGKTAESCP